MTQLHGPRRSLESLWRAEPWGPGKRLISSSPSAVAAADCGLLPSPLRRHTPLQEDFPPVQQRALCVQHAVVQRGRRLWGRL